jgi:hypothetical protein
MHPALPRRCLDGLLSLSFRPHEHDIFSPGDDIREHFLTHQHALERLLDIDYMDVTPFGENEFPHFRVPPAHRMTEMHPGINQFSCQLFCHNRLQVKVCFDSLPYVPVTGNRIAENTQILKKSQVFLPKGKRWLFSAF